jgi:hypothetical protein
MIELKEPYVKYVPAGCDPVCLSYSIPGNSTIGGEVSHQILAHLESPSSHKNSVSGHTTAGTGNVRE